MSQSPSDQRSPAALRAESAAEFAASEFDSQFEPPHQNLPREEGSIARLAAIVFTDVVGYSKRMQADEKATIAGVHADFERMRAHCAVHGGEVLNTMGDGMMLCFNGAVAAMRFALEMQTEFAERNLKLPPGKGLQHRVGIHIGDVYRVQGGHMAGDGVNIAARLEPRAAHGGIAISEIVYDSVKSKVAMRAERMGPQNFKNIAQAIVVYRVAPQVASAPVVRPIASDTGKRKGSLVTKIVWLLLIVGAIDLLWPYKDMLLPGENQNILGALRGAWQKLATFVTTLGGLVR